ncbi:hypothetical protein [Asticcacaulis machinosus]|uniref:Uncharacterized protein n=1 Tax=Asticcacaulis machinosus TaxID=2984211 RepID=A0ABT5HEA6_9CAUL|nr:hypothetical protein [Asticcacaulis machinosus]MDC7674579.1 hypothetical protein [Asticcacaulis machinosus]
MTELPDATNRMLDQYLDVVLHAFSTGKRLHSDTREKILYVIRAAAQSDPQLATYLSQEIDAYNRGSYERRHAADRSLQSLRETLTNTTDRREPTH